MKILFILPYPLQQVGSQRFRMEHYFPHLAEKGYRYRVQSFWGSFGWKNLYKKGRYLQKIIALTAGMFKRFFCLFTLPGYDYVYIHREATPAGPAWFEWIARFIFRKKIIYDFDDAIWIPATSANNKIAGQFRNFKKVDRICKWSYKISVGNAYLAAYAGRFNKSVFIIPTVVNTETTHNRIQDQETASPAIGWTGTFSTLKYLDMVLPVLQELQELYEFTFILIADKDPALPLRNYRFIRWSKENEISDLLTFHIGLMPLYDDDISKGKCGFKAIQYMSLGIPAVVSPVGVNSTIVRHSVNGFVCNSREEWKNSLEKLLTGTDLRKRTGAAARARIEEFYSVTATLPAFLSLFGNKAA